MWLMATWSAFPGGNCGKMPQFSGSMRVCTVAPCLGHVKHGLMAMFGVAPELGPLMRRYWSHYCMFVHAIVNRGVTCWLQHLVTASAEWQMSDFAHGRNHEWQQLRVV